MDTMADINTLDELGDLFEFGEIDLNTITDPSQYGDPLSQQHTHPNTPFQDVGQTTTLMGTAAQDFEHQDQFNIPTTMDSNTFLEQRSVRAPTSNPFAPEAMYSPSIQHPYNTYQQNFHFQSKSGFSQSHHVPPTPDSYEMHGETGQFMQQQMHMDPQHRAALQQRYHMRKDDATTFTPMVSPAGTPQYNIIPEFTTPGAYFSPLTSPMLHAQNQQHAQLQHRQPQQGYFTNHSTTPSSNNNSPVDPSFDVEMLDNLTLPDSAGSKPRRPRRKAATAKNASGSSKVKQSPATVSQKRKSVPLSPNQLLRGSEQQVPHLVPSQSSTALRIPSQVDSSEADSVSPEPSSEGTMGPPPRPTTSATHSPALLGQRQQGQVSNVNGAGTAATPKSLLTMRGIQPALNDAQSASQRSLEGPPLDDLSLPEAARSQERLKPSLSQINTQLSPAINANTPRASSRKTPKLGPLSTPTSARPESALDSPVIAASPRTVGTPSLTLKDSNGGTSTRNGKKRGSMSASSSRLVSPALVPKISPSIKPLLPEGTPLNTATQAMLLASKSNYQNLLEGNHLPGVTYPDSLSTGLTSKRTSHKVAEQGRRNRINEALKEMQNLIPKPISTPKSMSKEGEAEGEASLDTADDDAIADGCNGNSKEDSVSKSNSSKAATVELANEYIKRMQRDHEARIAELTMLKRENEDLKRRLQEQGADCSPQSAS